MGIRSKILMIFTIAIALVVTAVLGYVILDNATAKTSAYVSGDTLVLEGKYSDKIDLSEADVSLTNDGVNVVMRISGVSNEDSMWGKYNILGIEKETFLALSDNTAIIIRIELEDKVVLFNLPSDNETRTLYNSIMQAKAE